MSGPDAMHDEMPGFFPGRPGGERDEPLLDMIFDRRPLPPGAPPEIHDLARMLAVVAGPAEPEELAGEASALAAFTRLASPVGISPAALRPARRWLSGRPARAKLPLAAALVTAAAGLGSIAAAYVDVLPGPIQKVAHVTVGAPLPESGRPQGPPAVTNVQASATHALGNSSAQPTPSVARTSIPSSANHQQSRPEQSGRPASGAPTCTPRPSPPPTQAKPRPSPSPLVPGAPGWNPRSPGAPGCPGIPAKNAVPRTTR